MGECLCLRLVKKRFGSELGLNGSLGSVLTVGDTFDEQALLE